MSGRPVKTMGRLSLTYPLLRIRTIVEVSTITKTPAVVMDPVISLEVNVPADEAATTVHVVAPSVSPGQNVGAASSGRGQGQEERGILLKPHLALDQGDGRLNVAATPVVVDQRLSPIQEGIDGKQGVDSRDLEKLRQFLRLSPTNNVMAIRERVSFSRPLLRKRSGSTMVQIQERQHRRHLLLQ